MPIRKNRAAGAAIALSLGLVLSACNTTGADSAINRSLDSVKQPVVEQQTYALDLAATSGGLPIAEQRRLADWFDSMNLRYGDRIGIDDAMASAGVRGDVAKIAGRYGLLVGDGAPVTQGFIEPGNVRVVVTRSRAFVPGCPDWSEHVVEYGNNSTSPNYGCAVNGNLAAMVADPQQLLHGAAGRSDTVIMSSTKAIQSYREAKPTGADGLPEVSTQSSGGK
uniref:CpaD family pilus assembly protein n=1 Tax=Altererythrobacter segetis TaxID=1104773 RepID=UPI00140A5BFF|nr:CpaD family pilus assembly protein [Altererythrobacter segetis]